MMNQTTFLQGLGGSPGCMVDNSLLSATLWEYHGGIFASEVKRVF